MHSDWCLVAYSTVNRFLRERVDATRFLSSNHFFSFIPLFISTCDIFILNCKWINTIKLIRSLSRKKEKSDCVLLLQNLTEFFVTFPVNFTRSHKHFAGYTATFVKSLKDLRADSDPACRVLQQACAGDAYICHVMSKPASFYRFSTSFLSLNNIKLSIFALCWCWQIRLWLYSFSFPVWWVERLQINFPLGTINHPSTQWEDNLRSHKNGS